MRSASGALTKGLVSLLEEKRPEQRDGMSPSPDTLALQASLPPAQSRPPVGFSTSGLRVDK